MPKKKNQNELPSVHRIVEAMDSLLETVLDIRTDVLMHSFISNPAVWHLGGFDEGVIQNYKDRVHDYLLQHQDELGTVVNKVYDIYDVLSKKAVENENTAYENTENGIRDRGRWLSAPEGRANHRSLYT